MTAPDDRPACLRYWAAAKAAAGVAEENVRASNLAEALREVQGRHDERFAAVLRRCSYLVDGDPVGVREHALVELRGGSVVEVLPPFAGGSR